MPRSSETLQRAGENLRRLMAAADLTIAQVAECTGLDKRTIQGILDGTKHPHVRTLGRLAKGLGVPVEELFLEPHQLAYRVFDRHTNPVIEEVLRNHPELFEGWTVADFDELHSRVGAGGPLTEQGALEAVRHMNRNRQLHKKLAVVLESTHRDLAAGIIELLYQKSITREQ